MGEQVYKTLYRYMKPVVYDENTYIIRQGEPLDMMLFVTRGIVWAFESGSNSSPARIEAGDFFGNELLESLLSVSSLTNTGIPVATCNAKSHTKVEGFALLAADLDRILVTYWLNFPAETPAKERLAILSVQQLRNRNRNRRANNNHKHV